MCDKQILKINEKLSIPYHELSFKYAISGGPGGQHVNKTETKVILLFDLLNSPSLEEEVRLRLLNSLANRVNKRGILQITSQISRSQNRNKEEAILLFCTLLEEAMVEEKQRRKTKPSFSVKRRRLDNKKRRGNLKKERSRRWDE